MNEKIVNRNYIRHLELIEDLLANGALGGRTNTYAIKYVRQSLPEEAQEQARENIGAASTSTVSGKQDKLISGENIRTINGVSILGGGNITVGDVDVVKYVPQELTEEQKAQARENIGAISSVEETSMSYITAMIRPEPGPNTMGKIYLIGPGANNEYQRWFTKYQNDEYVWVPMGSTMIDLSTYASKEEVQALRELILSVIDDVLLRSDIVVLTKDAYDRIAQPDPNKFYMTYEDEEELP